MVLANSTFPPHGSCSHSCSYRWHVSMIPTERQSRNMRRTAISLCFQRDMFWKSSPWHCQCPFSDSVKMEKSSFQSQTCHGTKRIGAVARSRLLCMTGAATSMSVSHAPAGTASPSKESWRPRAENFRLGGIREMPEMRTSESARGCRCTTDVPKLFLTEGPTASAASGQLFSASSSLASLALRVARCLESFGLRKIHRSGNVTTL